MELQSRARELAQSLLAEALPRRWRHVQGVGTQAARIATVLPGAEVPTLMAAAWLHDIGYAPNIATSGLHALDGARWLRERGWPERIVGLVGNHSCATYEADERGLGDALRSEFPLERSALTDALWYSDMTTGPDGQSLTIHERLAEVRTRYGPDDPVTRFWARAEPAIVAAVERTEERMRVAGIQPM